MHRELYTIGEIARIKGVTVKALRFYDRIGLLKPHFVDPQSQYRYYHPDQFMLIDIIKAARQLDISPHTLIPYFRDRDTEGLVQMMDVQREKAVDKIKTLQDMAAGIEEINAALRRAAADVGDRVYRRELSDRHVLTLPFDPAKSKEEIILDYSRLDVTVSERDLVPTYDTGVLFEKRNGEFAPVFLFTSILRRAPYDDYRPIPGGQYACVRYTADTAPGQMARMERYLRRRDLDPLGVVQVELLGDLFTGDPGFFELQIRLP
mgnify:CR=1 FL=1